uniref:TSA: Wollemia nobilis Ref_Wollemi_Transcript_1530_1974 transcribed RNA sequence n=1 Tax=Wollemia nobilis TaxID=56998 RepID=A0A0C9RQP4_9CONI
MNKADPYRCGMEEIWKRQIGETSPRTFAHRIGGSQDLIQRLELSVKLGKHRGCVNTVHFNPAGDLLVSGSDDREIIIWDWAAGKKKLSFNSRHTNNIFQARIMPFTDDCCIVSCAADGQVRSSEVREDGRVDTKKIGKHHGRAHKLAIEPGSPHIFYSCGEDGVVQHFDLRSQPTKLFTCHAFYANGSHYDSSLVRLNAITIDPRNPNCFAIGGSDEYARVYDIRKYRWDASSNEDRPVNSFSPSHLIGNDSVHITDLAYSNQGELLVSYNDELIYLFQREMGLGPNPNSVSSEMPKEMEAQVYEGHRNARTVKGVNFFGPNTEYVISGSDCGRIFIWKKKGGQLVHLMQGDKLAVNCLEPHPHTTILATSGIEKTIKIWAPTAKHRLSLPDDAEELMKANKRKREEYARVSFPTEVIRHVLRLQRRHYEPDVERRHSRAEYEGEDDDDYAMDFTTDGDYSSEDDNHLNPRDCIIS